MLGITGLFIVYFIPNFFLLGPLRDVNLTANLTQGKQFIGRFDHIYFTVVQTDTYIFHICQPRITQLMMFIRQKLLKHKYTDNVMDNVFLIVCKIYFLFDLSTLDLEGNINLQRYYVSHGMR